MSKASKTEALWREAWTGSSYRGTVELEGEDGAEHLVIRNEEVAAEHGGDARILDDGRTVGIAVGDFVSFGIIERSGGKAPIAVNVWRASKKRKSEDAGAWDDWKGDLDYSGKTKTGSAKEDWDNPLPPSCRGDMVGLVRHQSQQTGTFWIECKAVFEAFGKDPMIRCFDMPPNIVKGDPIVFRVQPHWRSDGHPTCIKVRKAIGSKAEEALAMGFRGQQWDPDKGKGKGKGKGKSRAPGATAAMRMIGIVKKKSLNTDRRFVFCQDISDVYGMDAQIPPEEMPEQDMPVGTRIAFDLEEPPESRPGAIPLCRNITIIGKRGTKGTAAADEDEGEDAEQEVELEEDTKAGGPDEAVDDEAGRAELEAVDAGAADDGEDEEPRQAAPKQARTDGDPDSVDGWIQMQSKLFAGYPKLRRGWIRIRSKSTGSVYFYHVDSGESTVTEPRACL